MLVIPAIDLLSGEVVRLYKGDYAQKKVYYKSVDDIAKPMLEKGFKRIHIVDLEGSKTGSFTQLDVVMRLKNEYGFTIQFGGGLRSQEDAASLFEAGVDKIIIGSLAISQPQTLSAICSKFGADSVIIAADALNGSIRIKGWSEDSGVLLVDHIKNCSELGITEFLCTDISRDGAMTGPAFTLYEELGNQFPNLKFIASGGISSEEDIKQLAQMDMFASVVGRALYEGHVTLDFLSSYTV